MFVFYITCQSLFPSDLARGVHARTNGEAMRCPMNCASPVLRLQSHARSFACLTRFSRCTKKKRDWLQSNLPKVIISSLIGYVFIEYCETKNQTSRKPIKEVGKFTRICKIRPMWRNPEFRKIIARGIPNPGLWNSEESKFHWKRIPHPVPGIRNPLGWIQNPRLSWIPLHGNCPHYAY